MLSSEVKTMFVSINSQQLLNTGIMHVFFPLGEENLPKKVPLDMTLIVSSEKNVSLNSGEKRNQILEVRIISDTMFFSFPVPFKFKVPEISMYFNRLKICHCLLRFLVSVSTFMSSVSSSNINPFPTLL